MTEQQYQSLADSIATAVWEITTGNGRIIDETQWDSHMANCGVAVANTYVDGISVEAWTIAATRGVTLYRESRQ